MGTIRPLISVSPGDGETSQDMSIDLIGGDTVTDSTPNLPQIKVCVICGQTLPLSAFHDDFLAMVFDDDVCKDCIDRKGREYAQPRERIYIDSAVKRSKQWFMDHPERIKQLRRNAGSRRRAKLKGSGGKHTADDIDTIYRSQKGRCWWCGKKVGEAFHVDHRIPVAKGGSDNPGNLVISCPSCNLKKRDKHPWDFNGRLL